MRCFILFALIAAGSAFVLKDPTRFNIPCGARGFPEDFQIPEGATKIDLKDPTNLPEGFTIVTDPSEFKFPNGLTPADLKSGNVPAEWKRIEATTVEPIDVDCTDVVTTIIDPVVKSISSLSSSSISETISTIGDWEWKTFEPVITTNGFKFNDDVVPGFFGFDRDFKSSCEWFTTEEGQSYDDFIKAVEEAFEWTTTIPLDTPQQYTIGVNDYSFDQLKEMFQPFDFDLTLPEIDFNLPELDFSDFSLF